LVYAHHGISPFDRLFLELFASHFETYLVTFGSPGPGYATKMAHTIPESVRVVEPRDFGKPIGNLKVNNLRIAVATPWRILQLARCLDFIKPDIFVASYATTYGFYASACGWKPLILLCWGSDILVDPNRSILHRYLVKRAIRSAKIIAVDSLNMESALGSMGVPKEKIMCFPWLNQRLLQEILPDQTLRRQLNWQDKVVVVSVRMHEPIYSIDTLIRAIPEVVSQHPNVRFLIFGYGSLTSQLVKLVRELGIESFVHFAGTVPREDLLANMKECDIYVATSVSDSSSTSLLEAMFLGLPVVVTHIPGNTEWISYGVDGLFFDKEDSKGLAKAITRLLSNPAEAQNLARNAQRLVQERIDWKRSSEEFIKRISYEVHADTQQLSRSKS